MRTSLGSFSTMPWRRLSRPAWNPGYGWTKGRVGGHGEGAVAVPAGVAADLVVVQAALALGSLEAFLNRPANTGDADHVWRLVGEGCSPFLRRSYTLLAIAGSLICWRCLKKTHS